MQLGMQRDNILHITLSLEFKYMFLWLCNCTELYCTINFQYFNVLLWLRNCTHSKYISALVIYYMLVRLCWTYWKTKKAWYIL